jgi:hypothetical protein
VGQTGLLTVAAKPADDVTVMPASSSALASGVNLGWTETGRFKIAICRCIMVSWENEGRRTPSANATGSGIWFEGKATRPAQ